MQGLITEGLIYVTVPPLYKVTYNNTSQYLKGDKELKEFRKSHSGKSYTVDRFKGLGEMDPEQLAETVLDPRTRTIKRITMEDAERAMEAMQTCMGKNAETRRKFIEENAHKVQNPF